MIGPSILPAMIQIITELGEKMLEKYQQSLTDYPAFAAERQAELDVIDRLKADAQAAAGDSMPQASPEELLGE
jgi:hypothetical protein